MGNSKTNVGAVITAAGLSSRMGAFKPLLRLGDKTVIEHIINTFARAGVNPVVLVTGHRADELEAAVADENVICIRNGRYAESQMFDSACIGFSHIAEKCSRVFFTPVDIPLFSADTLVEMQKHDAPLVYPVFKGNRGHPVLISCGILPDIMASGAHGGLREAFSRYADTAVLVDADEGTVYDADTPEEFERLLKLYEKLNDRQD